MSSMFFCSFATVSPCEMCGPLMTKYEPSSAKNVRVKFGLIFFCGFEEEYFFLFTHFAIILDWKMACLFMS